MREREPAMAGTMERGLLSELARLDQLLGSQLLRARERGRSPLAEAVHGAGVEEGEAEGLVRDLIRSHAAPSPMTAEAPRPVGGGLAALDRAAHLFGLSPFERDLIALGLAVEIDARYGRLVAFLNDHAGSPRPTVGLAAATFSREPVAAVAALLDEAPLVRFQLAELHGDGPLAGRAYQVPGSFWPRLIGQASPLPAGELRRGGSDALERLVLSPEVRGRVEATLRWAEAVVQGSRERPLVVLRGPAGSGRETVATALSGALCGGALVLPAEALEAEGVAAMARRETRWHGVTLVILGGPLGTVARRLVRELDAPVVWVAGDVSGEQVIAESGRAAVQLTVDEPTVALRASLWERALPAAARTPDLDLVSVAGRFAFSPGRIETAARMALTRASAYGGSGEVSADDVTSVCRALPEVNLAALAQRLPCPFTRDDLVVAPETGREIDLALAWARHRGEVFGRWGAGEHLVAGRGLVCLFSGPPGTGKTMAAQVLARTIGHDLFRVDLSQVVSKYIGETEKNLSRLFDEARATSIVLFFDEADALFGKRTEVKDAHDRYANVETGFLLQRIEQHDGVCVLATNLRRNMDDAFLRRMHIVADFPMPKEPERLRIWRRHLPLPEHCAGDLDVELLATRFSISGGEIRNAVVTAAFLAAAEGVPLGMRQLVLGLWRELRKGGRVLDPSEFGPWASVVLPGAARPSR